MRRGRYKPGVQCVGWNAGSVHQMVPGQIRFCGEEMLCVILKIVSVTLMYFALKPKGLYNILIGYEDKSATAVCTLAFCPYPHADPVLFTGRCTGTIVEPVEGRGFG